MSQRSRDTGRKY